MTATDAPTAGQAPPTGRPPGMPELTLRLSLPEAGIEDGTVRLRMPVADDVDGLLPSFRDPELREAGNLPAFSRDELVASLPHMPAMAASGRLLPMTAADA